MRGYKPRRQNFRSPRKVIVIVCGGGTEEIYFKNYVTRESNLKIIIPPSKGKDPSNLVKYAKNRILEWDNPDEIWCVFDTDRFSEENILNAEKFAEDKISLILSNPCFEFWYLLHYNYHDGGLTTKDTIDLLKKQIKDYSKNKNIFDTLLIKREKAIHNSKKLNLLHLKHKIKLISRESNPSTQVFQIVEYIIKII